MVNLNDGVFGCCCLCQSLFFRFSWADLFVAYRAFWGSLRNRWFSITDLLTLLIYQMKRKVQLMFLFCHNKIVQIFLASQTKLQFKLIYFNANGACCPNGFPFTQFLSALSRFHLFDTVFKNTHYT